MADSKDKACATCGFRKRYDNNPSSILGRVWRWHADWCPGWKKYITSLPDEQRASLAQKYNQKKFM